MTAVSYDPLLLGATTQPNPAPSNSGWLQTLAIIGVIILGFWWFSGSRRDDGDTPSPRPTASIEKQSESVAREFIENLAIDSQTIAAGIRDEKLNSIQDIVADAKARWAVTHGAFIQATGELDNEYVPNELTEDNRDELVRYYSAFGRGFEKAAR